MALQRFRTMVLAITWIIASAALAEPPTALGEDLVPAGSINAALSAKPITIVIDDIPDVRQHATAIRDRFFPGAPLITGAAARDTDLGGHTLIVYGTPGGNPWLQTHAVDLPFAFGEGTVRLNGTDYDGAHLRVICAVRNPQNPERRAILYVASDPADLVEINAVFHGPTGWVVADGRRILASGDFIDTALGPRRMETDLDELAATVDAVHPAAIDGAPSAVRDAIEEARTRIRSGIDRATFEASLNHVLLALHDSHSTLAAPHATRHIDLPIAWLDEGPIVTHDTSHLRRGDRVVSIGGLPPEEILERLRGLIPTENDWWLRHVAEQSIRSDGVLRALGAGTIPVDVRVRRSGSEITRGLPAAERRQPRIDRLPWARFTIEPENGLGIFTLDRCVNDDRYRDALAAFFNAVADAGIDRIVVDLRRNGGGNSSVANEFLRYVNVADYADFSALVRVSEAAMDQRQLPGPPRVVQSPPSRRGNQRVESPPPFDGTIYVLTSRHTFSSGSWFATVLHDNDLATLVGEPTGGAPGHYGDVLSFTLPESGLSYTLSFKCFVRPDPSRNPATSLTPDVRVPMTRAALMEGTDPVLEHVRGLGR